MRIVALEEHYLLPSLVKRINPDDIAKRGFPLDFHDRLEKPLLDLGAGRLGDMDQAGITVQVLSASGPGADLLDGAAGVALARDMNDAVGKAVAAHPDRLAAFAHLPMRSPPAAADELERTVRDFGFCGALINGMTEDRFLDDPRFEPILARAEALDVPIYIHPGIPPESVRKAYYDGLPGMASFFLSIAGWGWHSEVAIHVLRLVLSGALDRHPADCSPFRRSMSRWRYSGSTASCSRSTIPSVPISGAKTSSTRSSCRLPIWKNSRTAMPIACLNSRRRYKRTRRRS
jgi:uncharacterized protein